jgi:hypothetical protein
MHPAAGVGGQGGRLGPNHGCQDGAKGEGLGSNSRGHCPLMCPGLEGGECIRPDADGATCLRYRMHSAHSLDG